MHELTRITLENELDLILVHKRSMRLAELASLSLPAQTIFATAVSEVSRNTIGAGKPGCLILGVEIEERKKYIVASLNDENFDSTKSREGIEYAKKLVSKCHVSTLGSVPSIHLYHRVPSSFSMDTAKLEELKGLFLNEPPISAYEELKRKNEQLQLLSENVQKSKAQYKSLTNALPLIIFTLSMEGELLYANEWLTKFTGETLEDLNKDKWKTVVHEDDYDSFSLLLNDDIINGAKPVTIQTRLRSKNGEDHFWHQVSLVPFMNEKQGVQYWIGYMVDIHAQKVVEETLKDNIELKNTQEQLKENQQSLENYISELNRSNLELQQFAFVASHDLQEPVRKLLFYCDYLLNRMADNMDQKAVDYIRNMQSASQRMRTLIQDLLVFSRINKEQVRFVPVDLNEVVKDSLQDLEMAIEETKAVINISKLPVITGDERMMRQLFENIIHNSVKYSRPGIPPVIDIACLEKNSSYEISFRDNGIGFDQQYLPQMFTLFRRLHAQEAYEGTGLGLAICRKIVELHRGDMWAAGEEGAGATFYVSLPANHVSH